jgi:uncharacterized GH25 family protein
VSARANRLAASLVAGCVVVGALLAARGCDETDGERVAPHAAGTPTPSRASATSTTAADAPRRPILRRGGRAAATTNAAPAQSGTVLVRVVGADDGAPIAHATVSVPDFEDEGLDRRTDADGVARFGPLEPTRWEFRATAPGRIAEYGTCLVAAGAETTLAFRLTPSVDLSIRVEDRRTGAPIADAKVRRIVVGAAIGLDATTDAAGRCTMPSMPDAVVRVTATVDGFDTAETLVRTSSRGAPATDVVLRLAPLGRMTGVVRAPDGTPVAGAMVLIKPTNVPIAEVGEPGWLGSIGRDARTSTETAADGRYVVSGIPRGRTYHAVAGGDNRAWARSEKTEGIAFDWSGDDLVRDFVLRPLCDVTVHVVRADGTPATDASLSTNLGRRGPWEKNFAQPTRPGEFLLPTCAPGPFELMVSGPNAPVAVRRIDVPAAAKFDATIQVGTPAEIHGVVVDDVGRPVSGATVSVLTSTTTSPSGYQRVYNGYKTDAGGAFRAKVGDMGSTTVDVEAVGHFKSAGVALTAPCDDARIVLRRAATLTFRVVTDDLTSPGIMRNPSVYFAGLPTPIYGRTDDDGRVRLEFEPRGAVQAQVFAYGSAPVVVAANLVAGEVCDVGDVRLVRPRRMTGRVVDAAGRPIANALVGVDAHQGRLMNASKNVIGAEETDADGSFAAEWAPPNGSLPLYVEAPGCLPLHATVTIAGDAPVVLTLSRGGLAWGEVVDAAGAPTPDVKIRFLDANGDDATTSNAHGVFDVRLAPGRYVVRADGCDDATIELREGGDEHVRLVGRSR